MRTITLDQRSAFLPLVGCLIVFAWIVLFLWEASPYGRYLDHGQWTEIGIAASLCRALPAGPILLPALLYVVGWMLMSTAMMLPTIMPLLGTFGRLTRGRPDRAMLLAVLVLGYLLIWGIFGLVAHASDGALHAIVVATPWLTFNGWIIGAGVLAIAGAFQFSALKYHCLDKCRTPFSFVNQHWCGEDSGRQAFLLGVHHGLFCIGCCWAIMMLMFVVGTGNVGFMLALGAVMAVEKNVSWGRRMTAPLGVALFVWSGIVALQHAWEWPA